MNRKLAVRRLGGALGLLLALSLVLVPSPALAVPPQPHQFWGTVTIGTELAPEGTIVSAQIDGVQYGDPMKGESYGTVDGDGRYGYILEWGGTGTFKVPADDLDTPEVKEGGVAGDMVELYVSDTLADQYEFEVWGTTELDLTVPVYTLTVTSDGCCLISVEYTPSVGDGEVSDSVAAGESKGFPDIPRDTEVQLTADDSDICCEFDGWSVDGSPVEGNPIIVTMDDDHTAIATGLELGPFTLTATAGDNGSISPSGDVVVECGASQAFTITPDTGYEIADVLVDGVSVGVVESYLFENVVADHTIYASFAEVVTHTLTMVVVGEGTVTPESGDYPEGDMTITATIPASGWEFAGWSTTDMAEIADPTSTETTLTLDKDKTVTATFQATVVEYTLTMAVTGNGTTIPAIGDHIYPANTVVDITATPDAGWEFVDWTGDVADPNSATTTVTVDDNKTVTANFQEVAEYTLTMAVTGNGTTIPAIGGHIYPANTVVDITATPDAGWEFVNWTGDVADPNSATTTVTVDGDKTVTATFTPVGETYDLTVTSDGCCPIDVTYVGGGGTVAAGGSETFTGILEGTDVTVSADDSDPCCQFDSWSDGGAQTHVITMDISKSVTAYCSVLTYDLTVNANPPEGGEVTGSGTYDCCTYPAIAATPADGYAFINWTGTGIDDPDSASTTVHIDGDKEVTANFIEIVVTYNLIMEVEGQGTVTPESGTYDEGDMTITATADPDWRFVAWSTDYIDEIADPDSPSTTLTLDKDKTVRATFKERVGFTTTLLADWNLVSTPILLDAGSDTLEQIFDAESVNNIEILYRWDAVSKDWDQLFADYELLPLEAIYVKVKSDASAVAEFIPSEELSWPPTRDLQPGLNLIGPAPALEAGVFPPMPLDQALFSIKEVPGGLTGYTMVVSPEHNQPGWGYAPGGEIKDLLPYKGYWVVMLNAGTLYGFSTTPP